MDEGSWRSDGGTVIEVKGGAGWECALAAMGVVLVQTGLEKED